MNKYFFYSFCFALLTLFSLAQEGVKALSANINYLYGDLKPHAIKTNPALTANKAASTTTVTVPLFVDDFSGSYLHGYPDQTLWSDSTTYISSTFGKAPWSIGVATFDGLNKFGYPYTPNLGSDLTVPLPADQLTSIPIDLSAKQVSDSVALTFYYQARGYGEAPEINDSLLLDFYHADSSVWINVWFQRGNTSPNTNDTMFKRAFIVLDTSIYFKSGFKFRFRNKASTCGDFDHWNLDYVILDYYQHIIPDTISNDFAFGYTPTPFTRNYCSMPWRQYDTTDMLPRNSVFVRNNGIIGSQLTYTQQISDHNTPNIQLHTYTSGNVNASGIFKYNGWLKDSALATPRNHYKFPLMIGPVEYRIKHSIQRSGSSSTDFIQSNDTVVQRQIFSNYYAFDDGSAEGGYYVNGQGGRVAGKFTLKTSDTLRAVRIYFDPAGSLINAGSFQIVIWSPTSNGPSNTVMYRDSTKTVTYIDSVGFDAFPEYALTHTLILSPGTYYIGYQQKVAAGIVVGFDKNIDHSSNLYYDSGNGWTQSSIYGSLMFRPVFGSELPLGIKEFSYIKDNPFSVYPNPTSDQLFISSEKINKASYQLYNSLGQKITDGEIENFNQTIHTSNLSNGIYFLILKTNSQLVQQQKIIIQH